MSTRDLCRLSKVRLDGLARFVEVAEGRVDGLERGSRSYTLRRMHTNNPRRAAAELLGMLVIAGTVLAAPFVYVKLTTS
jgi:hypothetical protein